MGNDGAGQLNCEQPVTAAQNLPESGFMTDIASDQSKLAGQSAVERSSVGKTFPSIYRLRKTDEYSSVFSFRRTVRGQYFVLHFRPAASDALTGYHSARLGTVVAKKLARSAVTRNLIKRLARERFRHIRDTLGGYDLVLRLAKPIAGVTRSALREDIASLFVKLPK